ncbi:hypothetical protein [Larsenimonas rhizosphaerae]|uniref:hypothetical protein n=1 Tax=Larsenimonas rhizosphaerae TaxID=2944682 RepID=UPI002033E79A|nr:hypothetical protein [Larsenimonas rhizosphaerae]MCM2131445.1 hypothetical protein [Larsenimonas rhizosphaerae]
MDQHMQKIEQSVAVMESNYATKADISDLKASISDLNANTHSLLRQMIMWSVSAIIATGGLVFAILRFAGS